MCFQNYQDYANDKIQYIKADSVMTVDLLLTSLISPITLNSVFYYSLSLENNLLIVKQQQRKANISNCKT